MEIGKNWEIADVNELRIYKKKTTYVNGPRIENKQASMAKEQRKSGHK